SVYRPITVNDAIDHLDGNVSIAGIPLIDSRVKHAAIDIDEYGTLDETALQNRVIEFGLNRVLHVFRTKSGGFRLVVFFPEPQPAESVRRLLRNWAKQLGFPKAEVFPKQGRPKKLGTGYNLPFFGRPDELASFEPTYFEV